MASLVSRFYSVERMVPKAQLRGELPSNKEAYKNLMTIALPSVCEMVLTSLIGSIDTMMVSTLGTDAVAAVGLVGQPRMLMLCMFMALNIGVTAIVARRKGQGLQEEASRTLRNALVMIVMLAAVLMAAGLAFAKPLMSFAGANEDTLEMSTDYFRILAWFLPIQALTMCINAAQRGTGNTKTTMYVNITANLVNVLFNYLLINGKLGFPRLGVHGAAYATAIGFCVGFIMAVYSLISESKHGSFLRVSLHDSWALHLETVKAILKTGGNAMIEQIFLRIGFFTYAKIVAGLGTDSFAAHQICMQFLNLSFTFADGIGVAGTSLVGQMLGQKRPDLSVVYGKCSQRIAITTAFILATCIIIFRAPLLSLFIHPEEYNNAQYVLELAMRVMLVVALFQPFQTSSVVFSGCLRGAGDTKYVARVMMICVALIRPVAAITAVYVFKLDLVGAWMASLIDMIIRMILVARRFGGGKWHDIKV